MHYSLSFHKVQLQTPWNVSKDWIIVSIDYPCNILAFFTVFVLVLCCAVGNISLIMPTLRKMKFCSEITALRKEGLWSLKHLPKLTNHTMIIFWKKCSIWQLIFFFSRKRMKDDNCQESNVNLILSTRKEQAVFSWLGCDHWGSGSLGVSLHCL